MVYLLHSESQETTATNVFIFFFWNAAPVENTSREQNEATFIRVKDQDKVAKDEKVPVKSIQH